MDELQIIIRSSSFTGEALWELHAGGDMLRRSEWRTDGIRATLGGALLFAMSQHDDIGIPVVVFIDGDRRDFSSLQDVAAQHNF